MAKFTEAVTREVNRPYCGNAEVSEWGKRFLDTGAVHGRGTPSNHVGAAIRLCYRGMSSKQLAEAMVEVYDIPEPSKRTLYEWVKDGTDAAAEATQDYPAHVGDEWVVDEMQVKVGAKTFGTGASRTRRRAMLASHLTPNRDTRAAVAVMQKAARAAAEPTKTIKTDRLGSYPAAVKYPCWMSSSFARLWRRSPYSV